MQGLLVGKGPRSPGGDGDRDGLVGVAGSVSPRDDVADDVFHPRVLALGSVDTGERGGRVGAGTAADVGVDV